jgi:hypothetical protein
MAEKVVKLKESDIKKIVDNVIKEQMYGMYAGQFATQAANDEQQKRLQNIANMQKTVDAQGIIKNPKSVYNNTRWADYIAKFSVTPDDIKNAKELTTKQNTEATQQQKRIQNIANISRMVNADGMIVNPKSVYNNTPWSEYISSFGITQDEIDKANQLNQSQPTPTPAAGNGRIQNITNTLKTVDAQGIIKNPASVMNNTKWEDYVKTYNVTQAEIDQAKASMGGGAQTNTQQRQRRQPDPKVQELQKTLVGTVVNGRKFTEADVDGVMGPITRAAQAAKQGSTSASTVPGLPPGVTEDDILKRAEEIEKARAAATPTSTTTPAPKTT